MNAIESKETYRVYGDHRSGNCWKVAQTLSLTGRAYAWHETDVMSGATRTPGFLAKNPNGRVPLLQLPDGRLLAESNAIMLHLAEGSDLLPQDDWSRAQVYQWLFFEQYSHEPYIAVARFIRLFAKTAKEQPNRMAMLEQKGYEALAVMDRVLADRPFFAGDGFTIADIALYAYTHVAPESGFHLEPYDAVTSWLRRVADRPGHLSLADLSP